MKLVEAYIKQLNNEAESMANKSSVVKEDDFSAKTSYMLGYCLQMLSNTLYDLNLSEEQQKLLTTKITNSILSN
jgi:hypothetical protein